MAYLREKIVLITGGSRGLGKNIAMHLAQKGAHIILTYHSQREAAQEVAAQLRKEQVKAVALQLDVTQPESFAEFAESVKRQLSDVWQSDRFDCLINNAGMGVNTPFAETTLEQFDLMMTAHLKAPFFLTQALLGRLKDGGRIINISSGAARFFVPGYAAYGCMKGGAEVLTRYLANELGPRRITVNSIAPGAIETDFASGSGRNMEEVRDLIAGRTPLGRMGQPDDVGSAVAALLMDENGWINGERIEVSGGIMH